MFSSYARNLLERFCMPNESTVRQISLSVTNKLSCPCEKLQSE